MAAKLLLETPYSFRERLCLFGGGGAGKTTAVLSLARHVARGKFYVIDMDDAWAYRRALETDFADVADRVELVEIAPEWGEFTRALGDVVKAGDGNDDWLVIDPLTPTWDAVQSWYAQQVMGKELPEYMIELRAQAKDLTEFNKILAADGRWPLINKEYFTKCYGQIRKWTGHLVLTAEASAVGKDASEEEREIYGHLGVKPAGQKRLHHVTHTVLLMAKRAQGEWVMTTAKDRNRSEVERKEVGNFAMSYLRGIAGWKLVKGAGE